MATKCLFCTGEWFMPWVTENAFFNHYNIRCHHAIQSGMWFKIYGSSVSGIFVSIFWDHGWLHIYETSGSKNIEKTGDHYRFLNNRK
jgi:hypothetical protein